MKLTTSFIYAIAPVARPEIVQEIIANQNVMLKYGIISPNHVAHFLGQCAAETAGFNRLVESLYYTTTKRLMQVWPSRFSTVAIALPFVRNPEKLANSVYGNRLGNKRPGDGWRYCGSGMKQTTGLYNFSIVQSISNIKCVDRPELLRTFPGAIKAACVYWKTNHLSRFADAGDVRGLTKAVQGGYGGLNDRKTFTRRALLFVESGLSGEVPEVFLRNGSNGSEVTYLQKSLITLGYVMIGNVDGNFGDATEDAVKQFQADNGLIVDGVFGPKTKIVLDEFLTARVKPVQTEPPQMEIPVDLPKILPNPAKSDMKAKLIKFFIFLWNAWQKWRIKK